MEEDERKPRFRSDSVAIVRNAMIMILFFAGLGGLIQSLR